MPGNRPVLVPTDPVEDPIHNLDDVRGGIRFIYVLGDNRLTLRPPSPWGWKKT